MLFPNNLHSDSTAHLLPFRNDASCFHLTFLQYLMGHSSLTSPPPVCLYLAAEHLSPEAKTFRGLPSIAPHSPLVRVFSPSKPLPQSEPKMVVHDGHSCQSSFGSKLASWTNHNILSGERFCWVFHCSSYCGTQKNAFTLLLGLQCMQDVHSLVCFFWECAMLYGLNYKNIKAA